ncbi:MAG: sugar ABC transporter permease [Clostridiales bacterium]|nr:sugar ABC transporter permease [Clostridiales bacterium]
MESNKKLRLHAVARREQRAAYLFLIPALLGLSLITYLPLLAAFGIGFTDLRVAHFMPNNPPPLQFVGFKNFIDIFTNPSINILNSIKVTIYFALLAVVGSIVYSMFIAVLLNRKVPGRAFFRAIFYVPHILPAASVMISWYFLLLDNGVINYIISQFGFERVKFLDNIYTVMPTLALISVWTCGNLIVIFLAGLQNVPRVYHEAAEIDGANSWQRFWRITIPCMTPIIFYNLLMSLVINLQVVVPALAITKGGPGGPGQGATRFMSYSMYQIAFINGEFGRAGAVAFVFFVVAAVFAFILFATSKRWIFYQGDEKK